MGVFSNLNKNMNGRAKLMVSLTMLVVVIFVIIGFTRMGHKENPIIAGVSDLPSTPTNDQIGKDKATDKVIFGADTQVGQIYAKDEEKKIAASEKGVNSHVSSINLDFGQEATKTEVEKKPEPKKGPSIDEVIAKRKAQEEANKKELERVRQKNSGPVAQESPWKSFLENERKFAIDYETNVNTYVDKMKPAQSLPAPQYFASGSDKAGLGSSGINKQDTSNSKGYEKLLADSKTSKTTSSDEDDWDDDSSTNDSSSAKKKSSTRSMYPSEVIAQNSISKVEGTGNINPGVIYSAVLQIGVNTDEISPVRAVVVDKGPLEGAVLTGNPARTGEKATITFESMTVNKKSATVKAIALDSETMRSSLADGVDNHTLERYSKLFLASFAEGYANALTGTQTVTNTDGSSSATTNPLPNVGDQVKVGIGKAGERFAPIFEREFDRPPTVTVEPNKSIYIMFMQAVSESEFK